MARNIRKGSKVLVRVGKRGLRKTPAVVMSTTEDFVDVKVTSGFAKGKTLLRKRREVKKISN